MQFSPNEAEKNPIVAMNWSTGIPVSTLTFLKAFSESTGLFCEGFWTVFHRTVKLSTADWAISTRLYVAFQTTFTARMRVAAPSTSLNAT